jgi:hypothetical protein
MRFSPKAAKSGSGLSDSPPWVWSGRAAAASRSPRRRSRSAWSTWGRAPWPPARQRSATPPRSGARAARATRSARSSGPSLGPSHPRSGPTRSSSEARSRCSEGVAPARWHSSRKATISTNRSRFALSARCTGQPIVGWRSLRGHAADEQRQAISHESEQPSSSASAVSLD